MTARATTARPGHPPLPQSFCFARSFPSTRRKAAAGAAAAPTAEQAAASRSRLDGITTEEGTSRHGPRPTVDGGKGGCASAILTLGLFAALDCRPQRPPASLLSETRPLGGVTCLTSLSPSRTSDAAQHRRREVRAALALPPRRDGRLHSTKPLLLPDPPLGWSLGAPGSVMQ